MFVESLRSGISKLHFTDVNQKKKKKNWAKWGPKTIYLWRCASWNVPLSVTGAQWNANTILWPSDFSESSITFESIDLISSNPIRPYRLFSVVFYSTSKIYFTPCNECICQAGQDSKSSVAFSLFFWFNYFWPGFICSGKVVYIWKYY